MGSYRNTSTTASIRRPDPDFFIHSPIESLTSLFTSLPASSSRSLATSPEPIAKVPVPDKSLSGIFHSAINSTPGVATISVIGGGALALGSVWGYRRFWRRIRNGDSVTTGMLERKRWVRGVVTSVGDGDNFRLYHTPGPFFSWPLKMRQIPALPKELKDETIHIRIAGVDAPECAHFGRPSQPHSQESLIWLQNLLLQPARKKMKVQLLRKDQYGRIVGVPYIQRSIFSDIPLPLEMLKTGMAVVYESGGAEYGPWGLEGMKKIEKEAQSAKRGLWALDSSTFEHPAEYKKRYKIGEDVAPATKNEVLSGGANAAGKVLNILSGGILRRAGRWWRAE